MKTMRVTIAASLLFIAAFLAMRMGVVAQPPKSVANSLSKDDDAAIRKVFSDYEAAWNTHDMKALVKLFRDDAEAINVVGMHWRGKPAIEKSHTVYHELLFKNHNIKTDEVQIRSIGHGHAIAVVTTTNDAFTTPTGLIPKAQNRQTYVLTKGEDGWRIVHFHNVRVDADAAKHDPVNGAAGDKATATVPQTADVIAPGIDVDIAKKTLLRYGYDKEVGLSIGSRNENIGLDTCRIDDNIALVIAFDKRSRKITSLRCYILANYPTMKGQDVERDILEMRFEKDGIYTVKLRGNVGTQKP